MKTEAHIIVGANYGDEGKGQITSGLCSGHKKKFLKVINILTNGGSQRGHTVIDRYNKFGTLSSKDEIYHVYHHFGSGTLYGVDNYFCDKFIINPMNFVREYTELEELGFDFGRIGIFCNVSCRWSTPYDMLINQFLEDVRTYKHGSVGVGIWETVDRYNKTDQNISIYSFAKLSLESQKKYLNKIKDYFLNKISEMNLELDISRKYFWDNEMFMEHFISDCIFFANATIPVYDDLFLQNYDSLIFENGQGLLLNSSTTDVHTTPSNTGCIDAVTILDKLPIKDSCLINIHYVTRPYLTRHGVGEIETITDFSREQMLMFGLQIPEDETNKTSKYQGAFRYGNIDVDKLVNRITNDFNVCQSILPVSKMLLRRTHNNEIINSKKFDWIADID